MRLPVYLACLALSAGLGRVAYAADPNQSTSPETLSSPSGATVKPSTALPTPSHGGNARKQPEAKSSLPLPADDEDPFNASGKSQTLREAESLDSPLSPDEIRTLRKGMQDTDRALSAPVTSVVPRITSQTVNLSPGSSLPVLRLAPNNISNITFQDSTGAPWPQGAPPFNANEKMFTVTYIEGASMLSILPAVPWASGNITVFLKGLEVPLVISLTSGDPDSDAKSREIDSRLDLRLPRRGPQSKSDAVPQSRIGLHDATLQAFLDGTPPSEAKRLKSTGGPGDLIIWQSGDDLFVRSRAEIRDEFEQTLSSADGTHLWKLPVTPLLTFSVNGRTVSATPELE